MLKETTTNVYKVRTRTESVYTDRPIGLIVDLFEDGGNYYSVEKLTAPIGWKEASERAASLDLVMYNDFSTGGGFHSANVVYNDLIYNIENEFPLVLNVYNGDDLDGDYEDIYQPDNMVKSIEVNTKLSPVERNIYEFLLAILSED